MGELKIIEHPLIQHKLTMMRKKETPPKEFRELLNEISMLMAYEVTRDMPLREIEIETPMQKTTAKVISGKMLGVVPILRAGLGMIDGILHILPAAKIGHIGLYRDEESHMPVEYYCKIPVDSDKRDMIVVDPMLATGGSASAAISFLKQRNCKKIKLMCLLATETGIEKIQNDHPEVDIFVAAVDPYLDENCYIRPGLGDAGDRLYGTK